MNWTWEKACFILGVVPESTLAQIHDQYLYKAQLLHPDTNANKPEKVRNRAEEELKLINNAYDFLKKQANKSNYSATSTAPKDPSSERKASSTNYTRYKPRPRADLTLIHFGAIPPGVRKTRTFTMWNDGGPCEKILVNDSPSWLSINTTALSPQKLPLQVEVSILGTAWGQTYSHVIIFKIDEQEIRITVEFWTLPNPINARGKKGQNREYKTASINHLTSQRFNWLGVIRFVVVGLVLFGVVMFIGGTL